MVKMVFFCPDGTIDNDQTVEILADASLICANAGFDWVAPSDMMDGRIVPLGKNWRQTLSLTWVLSHTPQNLHPPTMGRLERQFSLLVLESLSAKKPTN